MPDLWDDGWSEGQKWERARIITIIKEEAGVAPAGMNFSDWLLALIDNDNPTQRPCVYCDTGVDADVWGEELKMCVECSNKFYSHEIDPYDDSTWPKNNRSEK